MIIAGFLKKTNYTVLERFVASAREKMDFDVKMWRFKPYFDVFLKRFLALARKKWILVLKFGVLSHIFIYF